MADAKRDGNFVTTLLAVSSVDGVTPVTLYANPTTHRLLVDLAGGGGGGTVTTVSVASANGFAGSVATATTTPVITLSTTITGVLKGNGTAISAATAGDVISAYYFVAASDATTKEKAMADYTCDGTADEVQINLALDAIRATGGTVRLSSGNFAIAASINMLGNVAEADDNPFMALLGAGSEATILTGGSNINVISTGQRAKYEIAYFTAVASGSGDCISQTAGTERGNWQSWIHDVYLQGNFVNHTGWGIDMQSPFRMRFTNIEMNGVANGCNLVAHTDAFNPGNLTVDRMFIDLWNDASNASAIGFQLKVNSTTSTNVMNLVSVNRLDIAGGTNLTSSIGISIVGASASYGDSRHHSFTNLNIEDIKTCIKHVRGRDITYRDINYTRPLSGGTIIDLDSTSHNNTFENLYAVAQGASQTFNLIVDANGSSNLPNALRRVDGFQPATVTINATLATNTILEFIDLSGGSPTIDTDITNRNNTRTFQDVLVTDEAYGVGWNGSLEVPTKNAVYDKIETIGGGSPGGSTTEVQYNNAGAFAGITGLTSNGTYVTMTAPRFADLGFIADANGNELLVMDTVTSAVNEIKIANAATGGRPSLLAQGGDADVDLALGAKGNGTVVMLSTVASTTDRVTFGGGIQVNGSFIALASASTLNWNSGNAVITHSSGILTVSTGDFRVTTAGTNSASVVTNAGTQTLTNKRPQPRTASSTTASTLTPDLSSANVYFRTTQTATLTIEAPIGTPVIGETIMIYVDSAGAQTLTINATYIPFGAAFPATTTAGKTFMMSCQYNGTNWKTLWANAV